MQAIVVAAIGAFRVTAVPVPVPGPGEVLLKVLVTGLCRTDLKLIRVGHRDLVLPRIPGEEVVGEICETGKGVTGFSPGERIYVYPGKCCGVCPACIRGAENLCRTMEIMGFHRDGGFAEFVAAPAKSLIRIPPQLAPEIAVFAEPLSCCLNALELAGVAAGAHVGIWGAGPAGNLLSRAAQAHGATAYLIEPDARRREFAHAYAAAPDLQFDAAIVAVGASEAYAAALPRLAPRGRVVVFSGLAPDHSRLNVDFNQLHYHEQSITGAYGCSYRHGVQALDLLARGAVRVDDLISHRLPLGALDEALGLVERRECMKIHLYPALGDLK